MTMFWIQTDAVVSELGHQRSRQTRKREQTRRFFSCWDDTECIRSQEHFIHVGIPCTFDYSVDTDVGVQHGP